MSEVPIEFVRDLVAKLKAREREWHRRSAWLYPLLDRVSLEQMAVLVEGLGLVPYLGDD